MIRARKSKIQIRLSPPDRSSETRATGQDRRGGARARGTTLGVMAAITIACSGQVGRLLVTRPLHADPGRHLGSDLDSRSQ
jgi:hypothetical protein